MCLFKTMKSCSVCKKQQGKYKCPICLSECCSIQCYKSHKVKKCTPPPKTSTDDDSASTTDKVSLYNYPTQDTVAPEKLSELEHDKELNGMLTNKHLRALLQTVDNSENAEEIMQKAMLEPIFVEFADACLRIVEPD